MSEVFAGVWAVVPEDLRTVVVILLKIAAILIPLLLSVAYLKRLGNRFRVFPRRILRRIVAGTNVFNDGDKDELQGGSGRDWFFAYLAGLVGDDDEVKDKKGNEELDLL